MRVTLCLGGSIIAPEKPDADLIKEIAKTAYQLRLKKHDVLIVTGGGGPARMYIDAARKLGAKHADLDKIGIDVTRLHARMIISALGGIAEPEPVTTVEAAIRAMLRNKVPVMGGTTPGQTTDAVAAMLAKASGSEMLIFFSDVDGIYSADPKREPKAKKIERMTTKELERRFAAARAEPGMRTIIDPVAAKLIGRSKFTTLVLGAHEIKRLPKVLEGAAHSGTTIVPVSE
jgi:uridylate kinase